MAKLKPCHCCGGTPVVRRVGDMKQFFVVYCQTCGYTPAMYHEARSTIWGAKRVWNKYQRRVGDGK